MVCPQGHQSAALGSTSHHNLQDNRAFPEVSCVMRP
jgi:hypothetical protein